MNTSKFLNLILALALVILLVKMNLAKQDLANTMETASNEIIDYSNFEKVKLGHESGLYPTLTTVVGTEVNGKVNWIAIAHIGNMGFNQLLVSSHKSHYSNQGIRKNQTLSVNMLSENMIVPADFVGLKSGKDVDKSEVFEYYSGELKHAPLIKSAPVSMECKVIDIYETEHHDNFVVEIVNTYASENIINDQHKIDYNKVKPLLFEMHGKQYLKTGNVVGKAWGEGSRYAR